jgi:hypothetical protein
MAQLTYGIVHRALHFETLESYYNFDHTWVQFVSDSRASVYITRIEWGEIADYIADSDGGTKGRPLPHRYREVYEVIFAIWNGTSESEGENSVDMVAADLDRFLQRNPCWMPLHDPLFEVTEVNGTSRWKPHLSASLQRNDHGFGVASDDNYLSLYDRSAIFIRLPSFPYYSTCQYYKFISKRQFVEECPYRPNEIHAYWLSNAGWSHGIQSLISHMRVALINNKHFITPRAQEQSTERSGEQSFKVQNNGKTVTVKGAWSAWVDKSDCSAEKYAWNPWECHFIPLSNCNTKDLRDIPFDVNAASKPQPGQTEYQKLLVS